MNFAPYHNFAACEHLERAVNLGRTAGGIPQPILDRHEIYHYSILHKLRSAKYHVDTLRSFLDSQDTANAAPEDLVYRVNFHFDGFLHVLGSSTDIFARELLTYFGEPLPANVYFHSAHQVLSLNRPGDPILPIIDTPPWKQEFNDYRNTATHESLVAPAYTVQVEVVGGTSTKRLKFPIPDDPRAGVKTYNRNTDIVSYCERTLKRSLSLFNQAYRNVADRLSVTQSLPL
jgi:hypothetical protein